MLRLRFPRQSSALLKSSYNVYFIPMCIDDIGFRICPG